MTYKEDPLPAGSPAPDGKEAAARPFRVAVIGGGCAGVAAAWHIASQPGFEVQLFERSWRLGGKGASGRLADGRIHEHGLHLWLGCYENAFRLIRDCYDEVQAHGWGPAHDARAPLCHATFDEAFIPEPHVGVGTMLGRDGFAVWSGYFAPTEGLPGDRLADGSNPFTLANYLLRCLDLVRTLIQSSLDTDSRNKRDPTLAPDPAVGEALERVAKLVRGGALTAASTLALAMNRLDAWLAKLEGPAEGAKAAVDTRTSGRVIELLRALAKVAQTQLDDLAALDPVTRAKTEVIDIVLAIASGLVRDRLLFKRQGFDAINDQDYRKWLADNGARTASDSRFLKGIYDFAFAETLAAGVALRAALRMFFTYRGAMFWRMRSGMGDAVFAPLYRALLAGRRAAGGRPARSAVRIDFLHSLHELDLEMADDGELYVSRLVFDATLPDGDACPADPAVALDAAGCWPNSPDWLLRHGARKDRIVMQLGEHFDAVVLATGVDDLKEVFRRRRDDARPDGLFSQLPPRWTKMAADARTRATLSAQLWLDSDFRRLGWDHRGGVVTALGAPFDTVADMTHSLASERRWRGIHGIADSEADHARSVAYLCAGVAEPSTPAPAAELAAPEFTQSALRAFLDTTAQHLWPAAFANGATLRQHQVGEPLAHINETGSERYTLAEPKTIAARISPLDDSVANMTIAGDWTACGVDAGCVEAAVMSGQLACCALTGRPLPAEIVGFNHP